MGKILVPLKSFAKNESGDGFLQFIIIAAVVLGVAIVLLLFGQAIGNFLHHSTTTVTDMTSHTPKGIGTVS